MNKKMNTFLASRECFLCWWIDLPSNFHENELVILSRLTQMNTLALQTLLKACDNLKPHIQLAV